MGMQISFEKSDACVEAHPGEPADNTQLMVEYDTTDGNWLQMTYNTIRWQNGGVMAVLDADDCWLYEDEHWSDVIVSAL